MKKLTYILMVSLLLTVSSITYAEEVNVYSARKENLIKPLLIEFTRETGITVNLITGKADLLTKKIALEGKHTAADVLITTDAGRLYRAKKQNLLQPMKLKKLATLVPTNLLDKEAYWIGLSIRVRTLVYNHSLIQPDVLTNYEALADTQFKGKICVRSSNNIYNQSLVASMIAHLGKDKTQGWVTGLVNNFARKPQGGDRDQIKAVAAGQCPIGLVNTYYLAGMLMSSDTKQVDAANKVRVFWPNQSNRGAHINVSGAAITRHAKNKENAQRLIEFMLTEKAQEWYSNVNHEYPIRKDVQPSSLLQQWGKFKADTLELTELGRLNATAVKVMDRGGWR